jgi:hypothetical protein
MSKKNCFHSGSKITKKNGKVKGVQLYKCAACRRQFLGGNRIDNQILWQEFHQGKQTYSQLAAKYGCSIKPKIVISQIFLMAAIRKK